MAERTTFYQLLKIGPNDSLALNGHEFTWSDRERLDTLLRVALTHTHDGQGGGQADPTTAPTLTLTPTGGAIPASTTVRYRYTWVDANGNETAASPEQQITTDLAVSDPAAPSAQVSSTGGSLLPGQYYYVLTAYTNVTTSETRAASPVAVAIPIATSTNTVTLTLPTLPAGADGWNVYRRRPSAANYLFLDTFAAGPTTYVDDGSAAEDCNRLLPTVNSTNGTNIITIDVPGPLPAGITWKLYRSTLSGSWDSSFLHWVVEETFEGSGIITTTYDDTGQGTTTGTAPTVNQSVTSPGPVNLAGATSVYGILAPANSSNFSQVDFYFAGLLQTGDSPRAWVCPFEEAHILGVTLALGPGRSPSSTPVTVDIKKGTGTNPSYSTVFTVAPQATLPVGEQVLQTPAVPDIVTLAQGDSIYPSITQVGGGATRNDYDLTVVVYLEVHSARTTSWS